MFLAFLICNILTGVKSISLLLLLAIPLIISDFEHLSMSGCPLGLFFEKDSVQIFLLFFSGAVYLIIVKFGKLVVNFDY